jgi:hypothetical protein
MLDSNEHHFASVTTFLAFLARIISWSVYLYVRHFNSISQMTFVYTCIQVKGGKSSSRTVAP